MPRYRISGQELRSLGIDDNDISTDPIGARTRLRSQTRRPSRSTPPKTLAMSGPVSSLMGLINCLLSLASASGAEASERGRELAAYTLDG
jgi:hypothetical protein